MPEAATWINLIPDALEELKVRGENQLLFVADLMDLLQIEKRQAQKILRAAGAEVIGKAYAVTGENLTVYLEVQGREVLRREMQRRKRLAGKLKEAETELRYRSVPKVPVPVHKEDSRTTLRDLGLMGISLVPGEIRVPFVSLEDMIQKFWCLVQAIANDMDRMEQICSVRKAG